jgi:hypothetical protein
MRNKKYHSIGLPTAMAKCEELEMSLSAAAIFFLGER